MKDAASPGGAGDAEARVPSRRALRSPAAVGMFLSLALAGLAADLLSKHWVFSSMLAGDDLPQRLLQIRASFRYRYGKDPAAKEVLYHFQRPVCPGLKFTLSVNPGVVFGLRVPRPAVAAATVVTVVLVVIFFATAGARAWASHVAMAMVLSGALGNLYDRLFSEVALPGFEPIRNHVRDFIDCSELYYPWVFNVADILLVVGVGVLMLHWLLAGRRRRDRAGDGP